MSRAGLEVAGSFAPRLRARLPACDGSLAGRRTPVTFHHARPAVAAVGLERRPPDGPGHLPSDRPGPCGPSGLGFARCSRCSASSRTRSLAASLGLPRQRPTGRFELSGVFTSPRGLRLAAREAPERCVSPTSATDSRHEHPADCSVPGCARFRAPTLRWSHGSPRALRPAETNADSPWALTRRRRGVGALPFRLPDEPTKWSFA
jgi:hypothetical protein